MATSTIKVRNGANIPSSAKADSGSIIPSSAQADSGDDFLFEDRRQYGADSGHSSPSSLIHGTVPADGLADGTPSSQGSSATPSPGLPQTNAGSTTADGCYEHLSGMAVDLQLYEADKGTYPEYTGEGQYAWINENCWKYGFVLRYPADKQEVTGVAEKKNHYRYVGAVYAQIMHENNLALEELYAFLDKYTYEKPLRLNAADGNIYIVYSQVLDKDNTSTTVGTPDTARKDVASDLTFTGTGDGKVYISAYISGGAAQAQTSQPESSKTE